MLARRAFQRSFPQIIIKIEDAVTLRPPHVQKLANSLSTLAATPRKPPSLLNTPSSTIIHNVSPGKRLVSQFHIPMRPAGLKGKLWYKPDGVPRSKFKGLVVATLAGACFFTIWGALSVIQELDASNYILLCLIHIQRIDSEYASVDRDDFEAVHTYFLELCSVLLGEAPQEMVDRFFGQVFRMTGQDKVEAHRVMQETSRDIHWLIVAGKGADGWQVAIRAVKRLENAIVQLGALIEDTDSPDEFVVKLRTAKLKDINAVGGKGEDGYDVVG